MNYPRVMIASIPLSGRGGGVANFTNLLLDKLESLPLIVNHFEQGKKTPTSKQRFFAQLLNPFLLFLQLIKYLTSLNSFKPHLVHFNPSLSFNSLSRDMLYIILTKLKGIKITVFVRGWNHSFFGKIGNNFFYNFLFFVVFHFADSIIVFSNDFKSKLVDKKVPSYKIKILTNMVDSVKYRKNLKVNETPVTFLYCGTIKKGKGIYELLVAFSLLLNKYPNKKLIYMGKANDDELEKIKKESESLGISDSISFTGFLLGSEKIDIYDKSDVFVFPSRLAEGFPNVFCEALASGMPVISTKVGALNEVFKNRINGLFLETTNPSEIFKKMSKIIDNGRLFRAMRRNNYSEAAKLYDSRVVTRTLASYYLESIK